MKSLNIDFLLRLTEEPQLVTGSEVEMLVSNVISVLRANRGTGRLSDHEVKISNTFIQAMWFLFMDYEGIELDITEEDLDYIIEENDYMRMSFRRN